MLDFPNAPTVGQKYPQPAVPGVPVYNWDGEKWTTKAGAISGGSAVLYDIPQSLLVPQRELARVNIGASPFDGMSYSGMQINGGFEISQELGYSGRTTSGFVCDGWSWARAGTNAGSAAVGVGVNYYPGFPNILFTSVTTPQAVMAPADYYQVYQAVEGTLISRLAWGTANAQPVTIAFWSHHNRVGLYSGAIRNSATDRSYVFTYNQNVANVPEFKTITIPGCTDGVWKSDTGVGMWFTFTQACGSNLIAPTANAWLNAASGYIGAPGQVNGVQSTNDAFRLGGVIMVPGNEAPSQARLPLVLRPAPQEVLICQRYLQFVSASLRIWTPAAGSPLDQGINFPVLMRAAPTVTIQARAPSESNISGVPVAAITDGYSCRYEVVSAAAGDVYSIGAIIKADARI